MAQKITTNEIKFTDNELWRAMEMQVMDLVSDRAIQYLTAKTVQHHVDEAIDKYFNRVKEMIDDDTDGLIDAEEMGYINEGFMNATYIAVQLILEDVLPQVHLKPEWETKKDWQQIVKTKKENNNGITKQADQKLS